MAPNQNPFPCRQEPDLHQPTMSWGVGPTGNFSVPVFEEGGGSGVSFCSCWRQGGVGSQGHPKQVALSFKCFSGKNQKTGVVWSDGCGVSGRMEAAQVGRALGASRTSPRLPLPPSQGVLHSGWGSHPPRALGSGSPGCTGQDPKGLQGRQTEGPKQPLAGWPQPLAAIPQPSG